MSNNDNREKICNKSKKTSSKISNRKIKKKLKSNINKKNILFCIGSKGFTLIELIATIAIISIISTIAIFSVTTVIKNSKEKSLQTTYSSLKETGITLSKELSDEYWDIDNNYYISCVSVKDMKNNGYYKDSDFKDVDDVDDNTFVVVKKDYDSKVIVSSEIDNGYCRNTFNTAKLKVKSYTHNTISVSADCGGGNYNYLYYVGGKIVNEGVSKNYTYTGLKENTKYDLSVTCSKEGDNVSKTGNVEQTTGLSNNIEFTDICTSNPVNITINYNYGDNYFFKLTSSGSIDSKYKAMECFESDVNSCSSNISTNIKSNTWYKVSNNSIIVSINNNGTIYAYSSNDSDVKFSSSLTNTVTMIDKSIPNIPTLKISDNIQSGSWHKNNYTINLSNGESANVNSKCKGVTYQVSTDNSSFSNISGTTKTFNTNENKTYYFRSKGKNGNYSESVSYNSKNDQNGPSCSFSNISTIRKTKTSTVTLTCTDDLSGVVSKKLTSDNFTLKNISITSISSPVSISNGYKYTIGIEATNIDIGSYISLKSSSIEDNAGNGNNTSKSNTFEVKANNYTVSYNGNSCGDDCDSKTTIVTYGSSYGTLCTPTKKGYTFSGWYTASNGGSKITSSSTYNIEGDQTLYARCSANKYTVTYNNNGGSGCSSKTVIYGDTYGELCTPTRSGYTFNGWYNGSTKITSSSTYDAAKNVTLTASWIANTYTLTYDNNGGSGCSSKPVTYGDTYGELCTPSRSGYTFNGWKYNGSTITSTSKYNISGNSAITADWSENYDTINGYRCSGTNLYYITTCGLGSGNCSYTYLNDESSSGTVVRSTLNDNLTNCSNYQVNGSAVYTKTINRALSLVSSSNTIKVLNDNEDNSSATVSKNVTIETNGKTVTRSSVINVNSGYTLTMNGTGKILNTSSRLFSVSGTLKIQGGTYETTGSSGSVDTVYISSSGNIVLNDVNRINLWSDNGCGAAIESDSSNAINVNATSSGINLYGRCYGIWAKNATVNVTSSYTNSKYGVTNWIEGVMGYAIRAKKINFGSNNSYQDGSDYFNPGARSQSYTTNTSIFNVLYADDSINYNSGTLYSSYSYGVLTKDCYSASSCKNFQKKDSEYTFKPYYTGISDTIGVVSGSIFTSKNPTIPSGYYGQYFSSGSGTLGLRIVNNDYKNVN